MPSRISALSAESPRAKLFWACIATIALAQMAAFYMLCSDQVRKAQARDAGVQLQRIALTDCLQYSSDATIGTCFNQARLNTDAAQPVFAARAVLADHTASGVANLRAVPGGATAMPVSFAFR